MYLYVERKSKAREREREDQIKTVAILISLKNILLDKESE